MIQFQQCSVNERNASKFAKKMKFLVSLILFASLCYLASADPVDNRGNDGRYYDGRYSKNRDYYNQRRLYDNYYKQYRPDVAAKEARIVEQKLEPAVDGNFAYSYETENGIHGEAHGTSVDIGKDEVAQRVEGSYSYITPEGLRVGVRYVADENGYRPVITFDGTNATPFARGPAPADVEITKIEN